MTQVMMQHQPQLLTLHRPRHDLSLLQRQRNPAEMIMLNCTYRKHRPRLLRLPRRRVATETTPALPVLTAPVQSTYKQSISTSTNYVDQVDSSTNTEKVELEEPQRPPNAPSEREDQEEEEETHITTTRTITTRSTDSRQARSLALNELNRKSSTGMNELGRNKSLEELNATHHQHRNDSPIVGHLSEKIEDTSPLPDMADDFNEKDVNISESVKIDEDVYPSPLRYGGPSSHTINFDYDQDEPTESSEF